MTKIDIELTLKVSGPTLFECQDAITNWAAEMIKARIVANPQSAMNAVNVQRGLPPDMPPGLNIKMPKEVTDAIAEIKSK